MTLTAYRNPIGKLQVSTLLMKILYLTSLFSLPSSVYRIIGQLNLLAWQNVNWTPSDIDGCGGYCQGQKRKDYPPGSPMNLTLIQTNPLPVGGFQAGVYDLGQGESSVCKLARILVTHTSFLSHRFQSLAHQEL